ncbi:MAG: YwbE family protein [Desulforhopalus sp.]
MAREAQWWLIEGERVDGKKRADIQTGSEVEIVLKKDQRTGNLTNGKVRDILTKSPTHPHGIKVRLENGEVGRVKKILS